jgi:hypothetical protein
MKKIRKYEEGGDIESTQGQNPGIDDDTRARAKAYVAGTLQDETGKESKIRRNTETGDLYDSEMKAAPKAKPKAEAPKAEPKKAEPKKAEPKKNSGEEPSFFKGTKGFKNIGEAFKAMRRSAGITSYKSGGSVSSASKRADGCAVKGKTKGRMV